MCRFESECFQISNTTLLGERGKRARKKEKDREREMEDKEGGQGRRSRESKHH